MAFDLMRFGFKEEATALLGGLASYTDDIAPTVRYFLGEPCDGLGKHRTFPFRPEEVAILEKGNDETSRYLLGCLHYNARRYEKAAELWRQCKGWEAQRNLAICPSCSDAV